MARDVLALMGGDAGPTTSPAAASTPDTSSP